MDGSLLEGTISIADPNYFINSLWDDPDCSTMTSTLTQDADITSNGLLARRLSGFSSLLDEDGLGDSTMMPFPKLRNSSADNADAPQWLAAAKESEALPAQFTKRVTLSTIAVDESSKVSINQAAVATKLATERGRGDASAQKPAKPKKTPAKPKKATAGSAPAGFETRPALSSSGDCSLRTLPSSMLHRATTSREQVARQGPRRQVAATARAMTRLRRLPTRAAQAAVRCRSARTCVATPRSALQHVVPRRPREAVGPRGAAARAEEGVLAAVPRAAEVVPRVPSPLSTAQHPE
jgi:hypothetical protein